MVAKAKAGELNLARTIWGLRARDRKAGEGARRAGRTDGSAGFREQRLTACAAIPFLTRARVTIRHHRYWHWSTNRFQLGQSPLKSGHWVSAVTRNARDDEMNLHPRRQTPRRRSGRPRGRGPDRDTGRAAGDDPAVARRTRKGRGPRSLSCAATVSVPSRPSSRGWRCLPVVVVRGRPLEYCTGCQATRCSQVFGTSRSGATGRGDARPNDRAAARLRPRPLPAGQWRRLTSRRAGIWMPRNT